MEMLICLVVFIAICVFIKKMFFSGEEKRNEDNVTNAKRYTEVGAGNNISRQMPQQNANKEKAYVDICVKHAFTIYGQYGANENCTAENIFSGLIYFAEQIILGPGGDYAITKRIDNYCIDNADSLSAELGCTKESFTNTFKEVNLKGKIMGMMTAGLSDGVLNSFASTLLFLEPMVNDRNIESIVNELKIMWWEVFRTSVPPIVFDNMLKPELPSNSRIIQVFNSSQAVTNSSKQEEKVKYSPAIGKIYKDPDSMSQEEIDEIEAFHRFIGME